MAIGIVVVIWFIGYVASYRLHYRRCHGVRLTATGQGGWAAFFPSLLWPVMWFVDGYRNPKLCTHHEHLKARAEAEREAEEHHRLLAQEQTGHRAPRR